MNKILNIAQFEFLSVVSEKTYILSLLSLPLLLGIVFVILQARSLGDVASAAEGKVGVIDRLGLTRIGEPNLSSAQPAPSAAPVSEKVTVMRYDDLQTGLEDLRVGNLDILYLIDSKYLESGEIDIYGRETRHLRGNSPTGYSLLSVDLRAGLMRRLLPDQSEKDTADSHHAKRLINAPTLKKLSVESNGAIGPMRSAWERISAALAPMSVAILLGLSIYFSSSSLLESTVEERKNRVMEILLSSVREDQLIWGKLLGLGAAGLTQILLYLTLIFAATIFLWDGVDIAFKSFMLYVLYWLLGYLLFAGVLLGTGILFGGRSDSKRLSGVWLLIGMIPLFFAEKLYYFPNGWTARLLSYFPFTSPVTMVFRLARNSAPTLDIILSLALLVGGVFLIVFLAGKILRTGALMYGKRFTLPEVARWWS